MSLLTDYSTALTYGHDVAQAASTLRELTTWDERPLRTHEVEAALDGGRAPRSMGTVSSREAVEYAAATESLDREHDDGDLGKGKAPRVTGKTLTALGNMGEGWLVWDTTGGKATTYPMRQHLVEECADPAIVPLKTVDEVVVALAEAGGHAPTATEVLMAEWAGLHARGQL